MAWSDEPTENQLNRVYHWLRWQMPDAEAIMACKHLVQTATRKEVSDEMGRLKNLHDRRALSKDNCFDSPIWEGFKHE